MEDATTATETGPSREEAVRSFVARLRFAENATQSGGMALAALAGWLATEGSVAGTAAFLGLGILMQLAPALGLWAYSRPVPREGWKAEMEAAGYRPDPSFMLQRALLGLACCAGLFFLVEAVAG